MTNARDILPEVLSIFDKTQVILPEELKDDSAIQKFQDATKPQIPLLVLGNYSAGKSTFINSLVGYELLPASDHPTTAKVIQIEKCSENWIEISVNHLSHNICIRIEDGHFKVRADRIDEILVKELEAILKEQPQLSLETLADLAGFGCIDSLKRAVRNETGMTFNDWRKQLHSHPKG